MIPPPLAVGFVRAPSVGAYVRSRRSACERGVATPVGATAPAPPPRRSADPLTQSAVEFRQSRRQGAWRVGPSLNSFGGVSMFRRLVTTLGIFVVALLPVAVMAQE